MEKNQDLGTCYISDNWKREDTICSFIFWRIGELITFYVTASICKCDYRRMRSSVSENLAINALRCAVDKNISSNRRRLS